MHIYIHLFVLKCFKKPVYEYWFYFMNKNFINIHHNVFKSDKIIFMEINTRFKVKSQ